MYNRALIKYIGTLTHYNLNKISRDGLEIVTVIAINSAEWTNSNVNCKLFILSGGLVGIWINMGTMYPYCDIIICPWN